MRLCMYSLICVVFNMQASRVIFAFSHYPDKLRALELMEPVIKLHNIPVILLGRL